MRKALTTAVLMGLLVGAGGAWHHFHATSELPRLTLAPATRGDVIQSVACTGTFGAETTVDVGSQVSGAVSELRADFNSIVHKGDVLARIDPSLFSIDVEQRENVLRIPSLALRFQPTDDVLHALGEGSLDHASARVPSTLLPGMTAQVWVGRQGHLEPATVRVGVSDGHDTEIVDGLSEGMSVAVAAVLGQAGPGAGRAR